MSKGIRFASVGVLVFFLCFTTVIYYQGVDETFGYDNYNIGLTGDSSDFRSGYSYYDYYYGSESFYRSNFNYLIAGGYYTNGNWYGYYRGWMAVSIPDIDSRTYVYSASVSLRPSYIGTAQTVYLYILTFDPQSTSNGEDIYNGITNSYYIGSQYVSSTSSTYTFSISSTALSFLRSKLGSQDDYIFFGVRGSTNNGYLYFYSGSSSYLTINGDREAPNTPSPYSLGQYTTTPYVSLDWADVSDRPTAPNYGGVKYQVGAFSSSSMDSLIWTSDWTSTSKMDIYGLQEGTHYFRLKAKDAGGFETGWSSSYATTMIDRTPPTSIQFFDLPEYTNGTTVMVRWQHSFDGGSGIYDYMLESATSSDFSDYSTYLVTYPGNSRSITLSPGTKYYFQVRAQDRAGQYSIPSSVGYTTIDTDPPTIPILMKEPPYTKGDTNSFSWHPSIDEGVGVHHYKVQIATAENFLPASIVYDRDTDKTTMEFGSLQDNVKYYCRVQAVDSFHHDSSWSAVEWSVQDHKGPGEIGLIPLMEYLPEGPVHLEWEGAEDDGSGVAYYKVHWSTDATFTTDVHTMDRVLGQSFQIPDLDPDTTWYVKVVPYDSLDNPGTGETTFTTIDSLPPAQPVIDPLETFSGGRAKEISWSASTDALSGLDHYVLNVYTSPDRVGLAFTVHTTETSFDVPGLSDGTTYYYEVVALDRAGNEIYSALVHSTQDTAGPSTPSLVQMEEYLSTGLVRVEWGPSADENGEAVEYQVQWATDVLFTNSMMESPWLTGTNYVIHDATVDLGEGKAPLPDGHYYVRVRARDSFLQTSAWGNAMRIVVDTTPPDVPIPTPLPTYSGGTKVRVSWEGVTDPFGKDVEYQVQVLMNETDDTFMSTSWTKGTYADVNDLAPYSKYYFRIVARDHMGLVSDPSDPVSTTMDVDGPKVTLKGSGLFGMSDLYIAGDVFDSGCGVELVEISADGGQSWMGSILAAGKWSFAMSALPSGTETVLVRGHDKGGNIGVPAMAYIDDRAPVISITGPQENGRISGTVQITGSIDDQHLESYSISYQRSGGTAWVDIVPSQSASRLSGVLGTWSPANIPGGSYQLRITAVDALGQISEHTLNVTVAGANLNIDPAQITFSNHHPLPGDKVTVMVTISNFGDSPADGLTVTIYDGEKVISTETGVTVPANGIVVLTTELKVSGTHRITARATSDLYDSGMMSSPSVLEASEEEMVLEDFGGIFGLLALLLAIAAIVLVFVMRRDKEKKPKEPKEEKVEERVEKKDEEKKDEVQRAPPMDMPKTEPPKPVLPTAPISQKPQLPGTAIGGPPTPPIPPAVSGSQPPAQPPRGPLPQLKAAPATIAPAQLPQEEAKPTYTHPAKDGGAKPEVQLPDL
ncbi:MAG: fibronectin type III domain-containing protein [Thermoplasmatota archaeon]